MNTIYKKTQICPNGQNVTSQNTDGKETELSLLYIPVMSDLASKLGQIGPKWDKSRTF